MEILSSLGLSRYNQQFIDYTNKLIKIHILNQIS